MITKKISIKGVDPRILLGERDRNLKFLSSSSGLKITARGEKLQITGEEAQVVVMKERIASLVREIRKGRYIDVREAVRKINGEQGEHILRSLNGIIKPRSKGQANYVKAMESGDIVICIGPAGTGKTYLGVARAVTSLINGEVRRIVLTRPAVEVGERLGFLPGDFREKIDPYLQPLYDALYDMMSQDKIRRFMDERIIEIAPLAYMRGRNLDDSFVILDEGQNTTRGQMKMFLTRLGKGSKAVVTGDITQIDLRDDKDSGLLHIIKILKEIEGIKFVQLTERDIVRHKLVKEIVLAYERDKDF
jgi:phosphate starvation-inducible PhoH-like protein